MTRYPRNVVRWLFHDESHFQVDLPAGWTFRQDVSIKGWPHLLTSTNGSTLHFPIAGHLIPYPEWVQPRLKELPFDRQKAKFVELARKEPHRDVRYKFGDLCSFGFDLDDGSMGWSGHFSGRKWIVRVVFRAGTPADKNYPQDSFVASKIVEHLELCESDGPPITRQPDSAEFEENKWLMLG